MLNRSASQRRCLISAAIAAGLTIAMAMGPVQAQPANAPAGAGKAASPAPADATAAKPPGAAPAGASGGSFEGAARKRPMDDFELMEFLDAAGHARQLDRACPALFDTDQKERIYLAWRWARSVASGEAYPQQLLLTAIEGQSEHARAVKEVKCGTDGAKGLARSFDPFLARILQVVRLSEIR